MMYQVMVSTTDYFIINHGLLVWQLPLEGRESNRRLPRLPRLAYTDSRTIVSRWVIWVITRPPGGKLMREQS
jgi:hypothetical protein